MARNSRFTPDRAVLVGVLVTAGLYLRDLRYDFILDDVPLILMNQTIATWRNWKMLFTHHIFFSPGAQVPVEFTAIHYRPVYMLWLMLNQSLFGAIVPWWHLTSLLLHVCAVLLVYRVGLVVLKDAWTAALGAFLFALHPIHIESVSYVSASTDLLVTVFLLSSFLLYAEYRQQQNARADILVVSVIAAALAMLSKESAAAYPLILMAYEILYEKTGAERPLWKRLLLLLPYAAVVGAYMGVRLILFGPNLGPGPGISRVAALRHAPLVLLVYLKNLFWPWPLSFYYPIEWVWEWTPIKIATLIVVVATAAMVWRRFRAHSGARLALLWTVILFITPMLTVVTFVREDWVHDRHTYLVSVPFCLSLAALFAQLRISWKARIVAGSFACAMLFVAASAQLGRFNDAGTLYAATLEVAPRNSLAHKFRAFALWHYGQHEESLREFRLSSELSPSDPIVHAGYGDALADIDRTDAAVAEYEKALQCSPRSTPFRAYLLFRLAYLEMKLSRSEEAAAHISEALKIAPQERSYQSLLAQIVEERSSLSTNSVNQQKPRISTVSIDPQSTRPSEQPTFHSQ